MSKKIEKEFTRKEGTKGAVFFDSIDYNILFLTQTEFKSVKTLAVDLNMAPKNLHSHILKLVDVGLLDGVQVKNEYVFTSYFKVTGEKNDYSFVQDLRTPTEFLNTLKNYIERQNYLSVMDQLKSVDKIPDIKKK
jgi:predicted transcriptional regulator